MLRSDLIKKDTKASPKVVWTTYDPDTSKQLETAWASNQTSVLLSHGWFNGKQYMVTFGTNMWQINNQTGTTSKIRRVPRPPTRPIPQDTKNSEKPKFGVVPGGPNLSTDVKRPTENLLNSNLSTHHKRLHENPIGKKLGSTPELVRLTTACELPALFFSSKKV
jgi:hypothetical protein